MEVSIEVERDDEKKDNDYGQNGEYYNYEIECAARTLIEAEEIKADEKKMQYVSKCLDEKLMDTKKAVKSIKQLRNMANKRARGGM